MNQILFYVSGILPIVWGISHLFPTKNVVKGFGDISQDNKLIITMEWIVEGVALIFLGALTLLMTIFHSGNPGAVTVYWSVFVMLNILSVISLFTGFKVNFLPFKLCPVIFSGSSLLILLGLLL